MVSARRTRSASLPRVVNRISPAKTRSAPAAVRTSPRRRLKSAPQSRYGRIARSLTSLLALGAALGGAQVNTPRNQPRMGGRSGPYETRVAPYRAYSGPYHHSIYNVGPLGSLAVEVRRANEPFFKGISSIERKLAPGAVIGKNLVKARPVYVSMGKAGPILVGMAPRITPEQARVLISRGFKFNKNVRSNVMRGAIINPNLNVNLATQRMLISGLKKGKHGINVYPEAIRGKITKLVRANPYIATFEPIKTPALPK